MATILLASVGSAIGGSFGGAVLGFSGAAIGGMIGSTIGSMVDSWIVSSLMPGQRIEGQRLDSLRLTSASEGVVVIPPFLAGRIRRIHAAIFSFWAGVMPPMPTFGRSLL